MKKSILLVFILISIISKAQTESSIIYNSTYTGRNITFSFSKTVTKNEFGAGILYHINHKKLYDNQSYTFKKRLFAENDIQHFGITAFYHRNIINHWKTVKPFLFYDIKTSFAKTRNEDFVYVGTNSEGSEYYSRILNQYGPFVWIEQIAGIGFKLKITGSFYMIQKLGVGTSLIIGKKEELLFGSYDGFEQKLASLISIGIAYRFKQD